MHVGHRWSSTLIGLGERVCPGPGRLCVRLSVPYGLRACCFKNWLSFKFLLFKGVLGWPQVLLGGEGGFMNRGACSGESGRRCCGPSEGQQLGSPGSHVSRERAVAFGSRQGGQAACRHLRWGGPTENLSSAVVSEGLIIWATSGPPAT